MSSVVLCTGWALGMGNNKVPLPSISCLQTSTVSRNNSHQHPLRSAFREDQVPRNCYNWWLAEGGRAAMFSGSG